MKNLIQSIKSLLFNDDCAICGKNLSDSEDYICYNCLNILIKQKSLNKKEEVYYLWHYRDKFRKFLLEYKSKSRLALGKIISSLIEEEFFKVIYDEDIDYIVPVPINYKREQERGFNQVEEILKNLNYKYIEANRVKNTKKMFMLLDKSLREKNIKNSFSFDENISGKNILIFDDIITTGATIDEFKKELEKNGEAKKIIIFSLAVGKTYINSIKRMC